MTIWEGWRGGGVTIWEGWRGGGVTTGCTNRTMRGVPIAP